jgi:hypothetical protein
MTNRKELPYEPGNPSYDAKSEIIVGIGSGAIDTAWLSIRRLGLELIEEDRLSGSQHKKLLDALTRVGILSYAWDAVQQELPRSQIDLVRWDIELNARLQRRSIHALSQLEIMKGPQDIQEILVGLFNIAHTKGFENVVSFEGEHIHAFDHLNELDGQIGYFTRRLEGDPNEWDWKLIQTAWPEGLSGMFNKRFYQVQEVLYLGYAVGVHDAFEREDISK